MEEFNLLNGTGKHTYKAVFAVGFQGNTVLVDGEGILDELFDGESLQNTITNDKDIPTIRGLYSCNIEVHSFTCNRYDDPTEYDMTMTIKDIEPIYKIEYEN
jgi:hypothetical protein